MGDYLSDGDDTFAVRRGNVFFVRNSVTTGVADVVFGYGRAADQVLVGDWNGDNIDSFAVRRGNEIFIRNDFATAPAEFSFGFGKATDELYPGDWNGDNIDTFAVRRITEANTAADYRGTLVVAPENGAGYDRDLFPHWSDLDGDCINTRHEVLAAESLIPPTFTGCNVTTGQWYSVYDGATTTNPSTFDVDHVVPLAESWDSGASVWTTDRRELFANNLDLADHLAAVSASSNRSKGARDPAEWLPPLTADHCRYVTAWVVIKSQWDLTIDPAEKTAIGTVLNSCPSLPVDQVLEGDNITPPNTTPGPPTPAPTPTPPPASGCDPAYPTVCIPPPPPDLNCADVPFTNFTVLAPDPHGFDGNNDGIGCRS